MKKLIFLTILILLFATPSFSVHIETSNQRKIYSTVMIGNETYTYDMQLALSLSEAGIKYNIQDLIDYSNETYIPLIVKYESPVVWGEKLGSTVEGKQVVNEITTNTENIDTLNKIKSSVISSGGKFGTSFSTLPYASATVNRNNLKKFSSDLKSNLGNKMQKLEVNSKFKALLDESVPVIGASKVGPQNSWDGGESPLGGPADRGTVLADASAYGGDSIKHDATHTDSHIIWGPYETLSAGNYRVYFVLKVDDNTTNANAFYIDVVTNVNTTLASKTIKHTEFSQAGNWQAFYLDFTLATATPNIEYRVLPATGHNHNLYVDYITRVMKRGAGVTIAVIDTGVDYTHPDLDAEKVIGQKCFNCDPWEGCEDYNDGWCPNGKAVDSNAVDTQGHGTHCAGIIAGTGESSGGVIIGVAPEAKLLAVRVLNPYGWGTEDDIAKGILWAVQNGANIISMSLGGYGRSELMEDAINQAIDSGVTPVIAAGNAGSRGTDYFSHIASPGVVERAITVGATFKKDYEDFWTDCPLGYRIKCTEDGQWHACPPEEKFLCTLYWGVKNPRVDQLAPFSSVGPTDDYLVKPDVVAPGAIICAARYDSIFPEGSHLYYKPCFNDKYVQLAGTSMATPMVAGAVALIKQAHPSWTPSQIKSSLVGTAKRLDYSVYEQGGGRIDVYDAINNSIMMYPQEINIGRVNRTDTSKPASFSVKNLEGKYGVRVASENVKNVINNNNYNIVGSFSINDFCLNSNEERVVSFSVNTNALPYGFYSSYIDVYAYPDCDFSKTPKRLNLPLGFSIANNLELKFKGFNAYNRAGSYLFIVKNSSAELILAIALNYDFNITMDILEDKIDILNYLIRVPDSQNNVNDIIAIKGVEFESTYTQSIDFFRSEGTEIQKNAENIINSKNMEKKDFSLIIGKKDLSKDKFPYLLMMGYATYIENIITGEKIPINNFNFRINVSNTKNEDYYLGMRYKCSNDGNELMILPLYLSFPFNLNQNVSSDELHSFNVTHHDTIKGANNAYWGIDAFLPSLIKPYKEIWGENYLYKYTSTDISGPVPIENKTVWIRASPGCEYCNYNILTEYWNGSWEGGGTLLATKNLYWNPITEPTPSIINIFQKPFSLNISTTSPKVLEGVYYDSSFKPTPVYGASYSGRLNIKGPNLNWIGNDSSWILNCDESYLKIFEGVARIDEGTRINISSCQIGTYEISWQSTDFVKGQTLSLNKKYCFNNYVFKESGTSWCEGNIKKSYNFACQYSETNCTSASDSDGGLNYVTQGTCTKYGGGCSNGQCNTTTTYTDTCIDGYSLKECFSNGDNCASSVIACGGIKEGYVCSLGRCKSSGGGGCGRGCYMVAIVPYLLNIDPEPILSVISAILVIIEIVVFLTIYNRLKHTKRKK